LLPCLKAIPKALKRKSRRRDAAAALRAGTQGRLWDLAGFQLKALPKLTDTLHIGMFAIFLKWQHADERNICPWENGPKD
jgi:hypothetical protein